MANPYFRFKQFTIHHDRCAMKVTTDACLFGAWCARRIAAGSGSRRLLDIGAGTGLLSLMIRQKSPLSVDAIEIDAEAARQAAENVVAAPFEGIRILQGDVLSFQPSKPYDLIVSNPPFYENDLRSAQVARNQAHHGDGLKLDSLLKTLSACLSPSGSFYLLLPYKRETEVLQALEREGLFLYQKLSVRTLPRHAPFRLMLAGGRRAESLEEGEIIIQDLGNSYTPEFSELLRDYYLHL